MENNFKTIIVNVPITTPDDNIYITGNFGAKHWDPQSIKLKKIDEVNVIRSYKAEIVVNNEIEIKVTRGSWNK